MTRVQRPPRLELARTGLRSSSRSVCPGEYRPTLAARAADQAGAAVERRIDGQATDRRSSLVLDLGLALRVSAPPCPHEPPAIYYGLLEPIVVVCDVGMSLAEPHSTLEEAPLDVIQQGL